MKNLIKLSFLFLLFSCTKEEDTVTTEPKLIIRIEVDPTQERLNNLGQPSGIVAGNAGQSPVFNQISAHYLELAPNAFTQLGQGNKLYLAPEVMHNSQNAIDFEKSIIIKPNATFLEIPLKNLNPGEYEWVRLSLSYQNYDIKYSFNNIEYTGTIASFVGYNNYIKNFKVKNETISLNTSKKQGYWAFETTTSFGTNTTQGQSPEGATTVPNPLASTSPIPAGSCVVTGNFSQKLKILGTETKDVTITLKLSTNKSFEWVDTNGNNKWDVNTGAAEQVVDMGLRGLKCSWN